MPFGLYNIDATFRCTMDVAFMELINKIIFIYLDDLIVFSKYKEEHFNHLELVFQKCQEFGISLNSMKCVFGVPQGNCSGTWYPRKRFIEILIVLEQLRSFPFLLIKKGVQSLLGKINFLSKYISNFVGLVRPINLMLKKDL